MRHGRKFLTYTAIALALWLADSLLLMLTGQLAFAYALWPAAHLLRLLLRLLLILLLLLTAAADITHAESEYRRVLLLAPARREALYGAEQSRERSKRLLYHALRLAELMNLTQRQRHELRMLCYCYDIGVVSVHSSIARLGADMDEQQRALWDKHVDKGAEIAANIRQLRPIAEYIRCHEERYDGSGPKGLLGRSIPLLCRIFRVVWMYDYFTHANPHTGALDAQAALAELGLYSGSILDPDVYHAFERLQRDRRLAERISERVYLFR
ncbi:MAG: HD domain-containing phosphohydrolase [Bacillota bacterium]|nr:HD domain-containing phosphohydrolase [Bacillota bacterium]